VTAAAHGLRACIRAQVLSHLLGPPLVNAELFHVGTLPALGLDDLLVGGAVLHELVVGAPADDAARSRTRIWSAWRMDAALWATTIWVASRVTGTRASCRARSVVMSSAEKESSKV